MVLSWSSPAWVIYPCAGVQPAAPRVLAGRGTSRPVRLPLPPRSHVAWARASRRSGPHMEEANPHGEHRPTTGSVAQPSYVARRIRCAGVRPQTTHQTAPRDVRKRGSPPRGGWAPSTRDGLPADATPPNTDPGTPGAALPPPYSPQRGSSIERHARGVGNGDPQSPLPTQQRARLPQRFREHRPRPYNTTRQNGPEELPSDRRRPGSRAGRPSRAACHNSASDAFRRSSPQAST